MIHEVVEVAPPRQMSKPKSVTPLRIQYSTISSISIGEATLRDLTVSMISPGRMPAASARPPGWVARTSAPLVPLSSEKAETTAASMGNKTASKARET